MASPIPFLIRHWHGKASAPLAILIALATSLAFATLAPARSLTGPALLTSGLIAAALLSWLTITAFRTAERQMERSALPAYGIYGALLFATFQILTPLAGHIIGTYQEPPYVPPQSGITRDGATLKLAGPISFATNTAVSQQLDAHEDITAIHLTSQGGSITAARALAQTIKANALSTHAPGPCYSACTIAFIAGSARSVGPDGALGFHSYKLDTRPYAAAPDPHAEQSRDAAFFRQQGATETFTQRMFTASPEDVWAPNRTDLTTYGLITR